MKKNDITFIITTFRSDKIIDEVVHLVEKKSKDLRNN